MYEAYLHSFLNRKNVKQILQNKAITDYHINQLNKLFAKYGSPKKMENMLDTIAKFILYDLNNYDGRYRRLKGTTGTSLYTQILRYGKNNLHIYKKQNNAKIAHFKNRIQTWTNAGFSEEEAIKKVKEVQLSRAKRAAAITTGTSEYSIRSVAYWIRIGYSEIAAKQKVNSIQTAAWKNASAEQRELRIKKWLTTLAKKSDEEKTLINLKKRHSPEGYMAARNITLEEATLLSIEYFSKRNCYSNVSQEMFWQLYEKLPISTRQKVYFFKLNFEKQFNGKCVDFYDAESNSIIEFQGDYWHAFPKKYKKDDIVRGNKTAEQIWKEDAARITAIKKVNPSATIIIVWGNEYAMNPTETVNRLYTLLLKNKENYGLHN